MRRRSNVYRFWLGVALLAAGTAAYGEDRELLAVHDTVARFEGTEDRTCMGRTALCPDECGHSGQYAVFAVLGYRSFETYTEPAFEKQARFAVMVGDQDGHPVGDLTVAAAVAELSPGDTVRLTWRHEQVTRNGGTGPERRIVMLEKARPEQVERWLQPEEKAPDG